MGAFKQCTQKRKGTLLTMHAVLIAINIHCVYFEQRAPPLGVCWSTAAGAPQATHGRPRDSAPVPDPGVPLGTIRSPAVDCDAAVWAKGPIPIFASIGVGRAVGAEDHGSHQRLSHKTLGARPPKGPKRLTTCLTCCSAPSSALHRRQGPCHRTPHPPPHAPGPVPHAHAPCPALRPS